MTLISGWEVSNTALYSSDKKDGQRGSVLVGLAIAMPLFILVCGMVIDIGRALAYKAELNKACMIAAEESSKTIDMGYAEDLGGNILTEDYQDIARDFFYDNTGDGEYLSLDRIDIGVIPSRERPRFIVVGCSGSIECFFLRTIGIDSIKVNSKALGRLRRIK